MLIFLRFLLNERDEPLWTYKNLSVIVWSNNRQVAPAGGLKNTSKGMEVRKKNNSLRIGRKTEERVNDPFGCLLGLQNVKQYQNMKGKEVNQCLGSVHMALVVIEQSRNVAMQRSLIEYSWH